MDYDCSDEIELHQMIEHILDNHALDTTEQQSAAGIAKKVLDQGWSSLTDRQQGLFNRVFRPLLRQQQDQLDTQKAAYLMSKESPP